MKLFLPGVLIYIKKSYAIGGSGDAKLHSGAREGAERSSAALPRVAETMSSDSIAQKRARKKTPTYCRGLEARGKTRRYRDDPDTNLLGAGITRSARHLIKAVREPGRSVHPLTGGCINIS
jgi:hypothetical protein